MKTEASLSQKDDLKKNPKHCIFPLIGFREFNDVYPWCWPIFCLFLMLNLQIKYRNVLKWMPVGIDFTEKASQTCSKAGAFMVWHFWNCWKRNCTTCSSASSSSADNGCLYSSQWILSMEKLARKSCWTYGIFECIFCFMKQWIQKYCDVKFKCDAHDEEVSEKVSDEYDLWATSAQQNFYRAKFSKSVMENCSG